MLFVQPRRFHIFANVLKPTMQRLFFALLFCLQFAVQAQESETVLLTINDEKVTVDEFTRVYEKNLNLVQDTEQRDPKAYLNLFIDYKLKVQKAYDLELHKKPTYKKELANYRKQLVKSHLTDVEVTEELVKEAYDRTLEERRGQHILVRVTSTASPQDTISAYNKIISARNRILNGEDFTVVAKEVSEDPSAKKNGGDLGYFKAFKMVYPFESAAYNTEVGAISRPFRTRFGYHIVQPTDSRMSKGSVTVAHIMVAQKQADTTLIPEQRIQEVYKKLEEGGSFESLARNYSDDKNTAAKGGELRPIEEGQLSTPVFEAKAFGLSEVGAYTQPFKTAFGWHIVKLLKKTPVSSFEDMKTSLQQKIVRDARAQVINDNLNLKLRDLYTIGNLKDLKTDFKSIIPDTYKTAVIDTTDNLFDQLAFKLGDDLITYRDVVQHLMGRVKSINYPSKETFVNDQIEKYVTTTIRSYHEEHLEDIDLNFNAVLREYKEGLLLFDLLETEIWEKAKTDSLGLKQFFDKNVKKYYTNKEVEAIIVTTENKGLLRTIKKVLKSSDTLESIKKDLEKKSGDLIIVNKALAVKDLPKEIKPSIEAISSRQEKGNFIVYKIIDKKMSQPRSLEDVKGLVTSDYQKELEAQFVKALRSDAVIKIDNEVLEKIEKRY